MKRQFLAIPLLLFSFCFIFSSKTFACDGDGSSCTGTGQSSCCGGLYCSNDTCIPACDQVSGTQCTYCIDNGTGGCRPDFNLSCKPDAGYSPDSGICSSLTGGCLEGQPIGNCLAAPLCDDNGESCTGTGQGTCCDDNPSLLCTNGFCTHPALCTPSGEYCPGPAGTKGGCCDLLECNVCAGCGQMLKCQDPPNPITGYYCYSAGSPCLPCHAGDANPDCNPPEYTDFGVCTTACNGTTPLRYGCVAGGCNEAQNGPYTDPTCEGACHVGGDTSRFCEGDETKGINTALGCIKVGSGEELVTTILKIATSIGGGLALALILYGVFIVTTSAGMPDKLKAGSEIITSAVIGLIFILLSLFLIKLIGINILGIPGLV